MKLNITKSAEKRLDEYKNKQILLDFDDGVGPYSKVGECSLGLKFRVLIVDKDNVVQEYNETLRTIVGPIKYKKYSEIYMDKIMTLDLDEKTNVLRLTGLSGELTGRVALVDFSR